MDEKKWYDEHRELPSPWEWIIVVLFSAAIVGYGLIVFYAVGDGPRHWDVGQLPDTPAESIYSTDEPRGKVQRQLPRLPESYGPTIEKAPREQLRERGPTR
ncbi:hypothetical protein [Geomesophilobacter sediminis]|uniref:Uncharacterized protein n=1 Tax=Geomesophilobacter sediminis TaxID=2798584 RepID=A0A8J7J0I8_9BACT|nr:hypothetical protein [Geomesophilobacter sediminis]MBJ6726092.1 hypothetical protein [Geomesophilobacter sediminis]